MALGEIVRQVGREEGCQAKTNATARGVQPVEGRPADPSARGLLHGHARQCAAGAQIDQPNVDFGPFASYVVCSVIENGEGANSESDHTTDVLFRGTAPQAQFYCDAGFNSRRSFRVCAALCG